MKRYRVTLFDIVAGTVLTATSIIAIIGCYTHKPPVTTEPITTAEVLETTAPTTITIPHTEPVPTTEPVPLFNDEEKEMLACVIYQEAGADACCDDCRRRVADVVLNRMADNRFPDSMYEVLTQKGQYGMFYWTGIVWPERAQEPEEAHAVERAYRIAEEVLTGYHSELYGNGYIWQAEFKQGTSNLECCGIYFGK